MKLFTTIALFFALAFGLSAQNLPSPNAPQVAVLYTNAQVCQALLNILTILAPNTPCDQYVLVSITDSDTNAQAFQVTMAYTDQDGHDCVQSQVTAANSSAGSKTGAAFFYGVPNITIKSVQVTALEFAGATTTVGGTS